MSTLRSFIFVLTLALPLQARTVHESTSPKTPRYHWRTGNRNNVQLLHGLQALCLALCLTYKLYSTYNPVDNFSVISFKTKSVTYNSRKKIFCCFSVEILISEELYLRFFQDKLCLFRYYTL